MKARFVMLSLAAAAMAATACLQENTPESLDAQAGKAALNATLEADQTKTALSGTETVVWAEGDVVKVFDETGAGVDYTLTSGAGTSSAVFTSDADAQPQAGLAVYPAAVARQYESGSLELAWPTEIAYAEMALNAPMVATVEDGNASFKHLGGVLKFSVANIPAEAAAFVFKTNADFAVPALTEIVPGTTTCELGTSSTASEIRVTFAAGSMTKAKFLIPVPCGTYQGFTVELQDASGVAIEGASKTSEKSLTVDRADLKTFPLYGDVPAGYEVIWEGQTALDNWSGHVSAGIPATALVGDVVRVSFETQPVLSDGTETAWWQFAIADKDWSKLEIEGLTKDEGYGPMIHVSQQQSYFEFELTDELLASLRSGFIIQGYACVVFKVMVKSAANQGPAEELEYETIPLWEGSFASGSWGGNQDMAYGFTLPDFKVGDMLRFHLATDPALTEYGYTLSVVAAKVEWETLTSVGVSGPVLDVELTEEIVTGLKESNGLVIQGYGIILSKVEYLKYSDPKPEKLLWEGHEVYDGFQQTLTISGVNWNNVAEGQRLCCYIKFYPNSGDPTIGYCTLIPKCIENNWKDLTGATQFEGNKFSLYCEFVLSQPMLDDLKAYGLRFGGQNLTITKVTLK